MPHVDLTSAYLPPYPAYLPKCTDVASLEAKQLMQVSSATTCSLTARPEPETGKTGSAGEPSENFA